MADCFTNETVQVGENLYIRYGFREHNTIVVGTLVDKDSLPIPGVKNAQHKIRPKESVGDAKDFVKSKLMEKYQKAFFPCSGTPGKHPYTDALKEFCSFYPTPEEQQQHLNWENWATSTFRGTYTYLCNRVLPRLDKLGVNPGPEKIQPMQEELVDLIVTGKPQDEPLSKETVSQIRQNLLYKMRRCDILYRQLQLLLPWRNLPDLNLRMKGEAVPNVEQCKSLPDPVRIRFAAILRQQMESPYGGVALCLGFMFFCGLRTAESAALTFGDIHTSGETWTVQVKKQLSGTNVTPTLKTESSYRRLPLVQFLKDMVSTRKAYLQTLKHAKKTAEEESKEEPMDHLSIDNLPISYQPGTSQLFVPSSQISAAGRALLLASGCTVSYWEDMLDLMSGKLDLSQDGEKLRDITAYALRRDFASRAANSCGVTERELDLALGHKIRCSAVEKRAFYSLPSLSAFRQKLENYIFDPKHTAHPSFLPIVVDGAQDLTLLPVTQARLFFKKDTVIRLNLLSLDAGQIIQANFSDGKVLHQKQVPLEDLPVERSARQLLANVPSPGWYEKSITAVESAKVRGAVEKIWKEIFKYGKKV